VAIKFQYNKTSLTNLGKQLKVRQKALPTLKNKESALRSSVLEAKKESERLASELEASLKRYDYLAALWNEFDPGLVRIVDVDLRTVKVAGNGTIVTLESNWPTLKTGEHTVTMSPGTGTATMTWQERNV
jgi:V/A-type H+-transporting ATPase subunit D